MKSLVHAVAKFTKYELILVALIFFQFFANISWIGLNTLPFPWDQAGHTLISYRFVDYYQGLLATPFLQITDYYPPIVHIIVSLLMLMFGREPNIGPFVVTIFFLISIVYLYRYTHELFKHKLGAGNSSSKKLALLAAAIFSFLPGLNNLSRYFLLELPFVAFILVALYYLEKSELFSDKRNSILFGVFAGLALLVKWTAGIYFIVPVLFVLIPLFNKEIKSGFVHLFQRSWLKYGLYSLGILLVIALPWYFTNYQVIADFSKISATGEASDPQKLLTLENIKFYFYHITNFQITWLGMLAFLLSIPAVLKFKSLGLKILIPIAFAYVVFTFIANKDLRYVVFLTPYFSIAIAIGLYALFKGSVKKGVVVTALFFAFFLMNFFSLAFGFPFDPEKINRRESIIIPGIGDINIINFGRDTSYYLVPKYTNHVKWPNMVVADELSKHDPSNKIKILVISEKPFFNEVNLNVSAQQLEKRNIKFTAPYRLEPFGSDEEMKTYLGDFSLILIAEKDLGPIEAIRHIVPMRQLKDYIETQRASDIKQINTYYTPDGDKVHVYKGTTIPTNVIIEEMSKHDPTNKVNVLLVADNPQLLAERFETDRKLANKENIEFLNPDPEVADIDSYLVNYQVVLVSQNAQNTPGSFANEILQNPPAYLKKINTYYLPNGDLLDVYRTN